MAPVSATRNSARLRETMLSNILFNPHFIPATPRRNGYCGNRGLRTQLMTWQERQPRSSLLALIGPYVPCLEVLANIMSQPLGVRFTGDETGEMGQYSEPFVSGYKMVPQQLWTALFILRQPRVSGLFPPKTYHHRFSGGYVYDSSKAVSQCHK